ncbi:2Fe-2S iron-sulfur cluster binding domain-containing protein [Pseudomonas sp. SORT22]|uniref:2Fe-2S iron-sulfur cluster-binding protein n=1 Tax=Pseudomonas sp. SORT22 TaxID=2813842 RepID=UPI001BCA8040|nr:2Fe-2S iron-sulfur cluster-binding protein [Pseudomonas sp. SORT22]QVM98364.1 2Fe-2S iron-sulfur cluster binding domain-containing protein [Pseudomonas sp. SORT22]
MSESLQLSCVSVVDKTPLVKVFRFRVVGTVADWCAFKAGRYVSLGFPDIEGLLQHRCYSIVRIVAPNMFEVAIQKSGRHQVADALFHRLSIGDLVSCKPPAGSITVDRLASCKQILMLAGGIGVTLPMALIEELSALHKLRGSGPVVRLVLCSPRREETPFLQELLTLQASAQWFSLDLCLTREPQKNDGGSFHAGRPTTALFDSLPLPDAVVICGSQDFARSMQQRVEMYPASEVMIEAFSSPVARALGAEETSSATNCLQVEGLSEVIALRPGTSLLEHLLEADIALAHECRAGICGSCRIKLLRGGCTSEMDFALGVHERKAGYVLACCTFPAGESMTVALP